MNDIVETLLRLNAEDDIDGMVRCAREEGRDPSTLIHAVYRLIVAGEIRPAYVAAMLLANSGIPNPVVSIALAVGGLVFGNAGEEARGRAMLRSQMDTLDAGQVVNVYTAVIEPVFKRLLEGALKTSDQAMVLRILDVMKEGTPRFRTIFDLQAPVPTLDIEELRRRGRKSSRLVEYSVPPAGVPRQTRRAVVAVRELFFPSLPWSRPLDLGPRLVAGMQSYGWDTSFYGMKCLNLLEDYRGIIKFCKHRQADVLVLDDNMIEAETARPARAEMIAQLRREMPALKIVSILFDSWVLDPAVLTECLAAVDCVWETTSPSLALWKDPAFAGKLLHMQVPHAGNDGPPEPPMQPRVSFYGGVKGYNWHRAFWMAVVSSLDLPVEKTLSSHASDGLPALESYALYMRQLAEAPCSLNLSMRSDLSCIVTGRCFETIVTGSLLVQEATPDMDYYFISGEHYLSFDSVTELRAVIDFIGKNKEEADAIRHRGNAFARERYSDDNIIGYLDNILFF